MKDRRAGFGASNPFHAVSILPDQRACLAVESIRLQRFLSEEAPGLPLLNCGAQECGCKYIHHGDRRGGARDRRLALTDDTDESEFWSQRERRVAVGRRYQDQQIA
ncbi:MAG: hypothetical protein R3E64_06925 [Halioglobus sp.]